MASTDKAAAVFGFLNRAAILLNSISYILLEQLILCVIFNCAYMKGRQTWDVKSSSRKKQQHGLGVRKGCSRKGKGKGPEKPLNVRRETRNGKSSSSGGVKPRSKYYAWRSARHWVQKKEKGRLSKTLRNIYALI